MSTSLLRLALCATPFVSLLLFQVPAPAQAPVCAGPADRLEHPLRRVAQRLATGQSLTIVAIGSSSTSGAGASSSAASYPSRLEVELQQRFPTRMIRVLNRGVGGEEVGDMLARFDRAVFAENPDLILWQVGTNTVLRGHSIPGAQSLIHEGLERLKASGADVVLIDPQFAPKVLVQPDHEAMVRFISTEAKAQNVSVFHRFEVMRQWRQAQEIPFEVFLSSDGLHLNDWSYSCLAKLLAVAIDEAATRAPAIAGGLPPMGGMNAP
jgi:lysophospholipase L1-like esterase